MEDFYAKYIKNSLIEPLNLIVEQGHEIEKNGRVAVQVSKNNQSFDVQITGNAVYVKDFQFFRKLRVGEFLHLNYLVQSL